MIKEILISCLFIMYAFVSAGILCLAMAYPFFASGLPSLTPFLLYPVTILIGATQERCIEYFFQRMPNDFS